MSKKNYEYLSKNFGEETGLNLKSQVAILGNPKESGSQIF